MGKETQTGYLIVKTVHLVIAIVLILFAVGGNLYLYKYRLDNVELKAKDSQKRIADLEKRLILMDLKLDLLLQKNGISLPKYRLRGSQ